jgi:hypothetical protein
MIHYAGGKRRVLFRASGKTFYRGADDKEDDNFFITTEHVFESDIVDWDFGHGGVVYIELANGESWKRTWKKNPNKNDRGNPGHSNWELLEVL